MSEKIITKVYCNFCNKEIKEGEVYRILRGYLDNIEFKFNNKKFIMDIDINIIEDIKNCLYEEKIIHICEKCENKYKKDLKKIITKAINKALFNEGKEIGEEK